MTKTKVAVFGAGIVGVLCAWRLLKDGHEVTLVDRLGPGEGCSFGNACLISPDAVVPYMSPSSLWLVPKWLIDPLGPLSVRWTDLPASLPWLTAWVRSSSTQGALRTGRGMAMLHQGSLDAYTALLREVDGLELLKRTGQMQVSRAAGTFAPGRITQILRSEFGVETRLLDAGGLRDMVPALAEDFKSGILFPNNGHTLSSFRLVKTFAEFFLRQGGRLLRENLKGFRQTDGKLTGLVLDNATLEADQVVLAAGIGSRDLLQGLGAHVPLQAERGYHLTFAKPGIELPFPVSNRDQSFAVTPMEDGIRFAGTVEIAKAGSSPNWNRAKILATLGRQMFPGLQTEPSTSWMGSRPSLPDGLPVLGRHPRLANLWLAFGNGHYGLTAAPAMAETIGALLKGTPPRIDTKEFALGRF